MYQNNPKRNNLFWYAVPAVIVFSAIFIMRGATFKDDAYIFYRYAANWAAGYGPVFNIGEYVEGYSSFLWTAILAVGAYSSFDLVNLAPVLNLFIGITCLFLVSHFCNFIQFSRPRLMAVTLPLFCALSYGFYYYAASGMDTIIFSLVLLLCILSLCKSRKTGNFLFTLPFLVLLNIVRAEGFMYSIVLLAVLTYFVFIEKRKFPKKLLVTLIAFAVLTFLMFGIRHSIYSEWMPATVLAKGYGTEMFKEALFHGDFHAFKSFVKVILSGFRYEAVLFFLGAWFPFIMLLWDKNKNDILLWLIAFSIITNIFVSVWAGGDYMPFNRHLIPVLPVLIVFVAWSMDLLFRKYLDGSIRKKVTLYLTVTLLTLSWLVFFAGPLIHEKKYVESGRSLYLRKIGSVMKDTNVPTTLLTNMIGKISYYAGPNVYVRDILGLTDIHNARYGNDWGFRWGKGVCGRTDYIYSFSNPFDIFFYNSENLHFRFIAFCKENSSRCQNYRFFKSEKWPKEHFYLIANIKHPVSTLLKEKFGAIPLPINDNIKYINFIKFYYR